MVDVFKRRHGCGALIGLRESCVVCADRKRAELHASGVAAMRGQEHCRHPEERWRRDTDECGLCGIRLQQVRSAAADRRWAEERQAAVERLTKPVYEPPSGYTGEWAGEHQKWLKMVYTPLRMMPDGADKERLANAMDEIAEYKPLSVTREQMEAALNSRLARLREPPPVGAEVSYAQALKHMHEAPEARYERRATLGTHGIDVYRVCQGQLCYQADGLWQDVYCQDERSAYRRLPDATALPAIGEEVPWEVALADMKARPQGGNRALAVYENVAWSGAQFHWGGDLMVLPPKQERFRKASVHEPERVRWVRLA